MEFLLRLACLPKNSVNFVRPLESKGMTFPCLFRRLANQKSKLSTTEGGKQYIIEQTRRLEFLVNWKKYNLHLTQKHVFLGALIDLEKCMIFPTYECYQALIYLIQTSDKFQGRTFLRLLGIMNSCID